MALARWTRNVNFEAATYRFTLMADDGARLYVDGKKALGTWGASGPGDLYLGRAPAGRQAHRATGLP